MNDNLKQQIHNYDLGLFFEQIEQNLQTHFKNDKVKKMTKKYKEWIMSLNIVRLKKKLRHLITEYRVDHIHGKHQTNKQKIAYKLANTLYKKYQADKKDGLTLLEIETLNKFYKERTLFYNET